MHDWRINETKWRMKNGVNGEMKSKLMKMNSLKMVDSIIKTQNQNKKQRVAVILIENVEIALFMVGNLNGLHQHN